MTIRIDDRKTNDQVIQARAFKAAQDTYIEVLTDLRLKEGGGFKVVSQNRRALRAALEAAAPHMLVTVTTSEELDALPVGSVVRTAGTESQSPRVAIKDAMWKNESEWFVADSSDFCLDSAELDDLPATVLHLGPPHE